MIAFYVLCAISLCIISYHIGHMIGRDSVTPEDMLWKDRIDTGYGPR